MCIKSPAIQGKLAAFIAFAIAISFLSRFCRFQIQHLFFLFDISQHRCKGLMLLETYSSLDGEKLLNCLPKFLNIVKEVTGDPSFSMFNLSLKEDWSKTKKFCHSLHGKDQRNQTNGMAQLNNHTDKVHCETQNNHANHMHSECHKHNDNATQNATTTSSN